MIDFFDNFTIKINLYMQNLFFFIIISLVSTSTSLDLKTKYNPIVAHRGAWKALNFPENSIASLANAIKLGCKGTEFDVRMTADSVLIVNHDPIYNGLNIEKVNYAELLHFTLSNGEKIPTLEEYLMAGGKKNKLTRLICEIKPSEISKDRGVTIAQKVDSLVKSLKLTSIVDYISFNIDILKTLIRLNPKSHTQYLNGDLTPQEVKSLGISGLDYHHLVFRKNPEWITEAKRLNLALNVWTVNKEEDIDYFLQQGFDLITTNEPELLKVRMNVIKTKP